MKKLILSLTAFCAAVSLNAQTPNSDLENWSNGEPDDWVYDFGDGSGVVAGTNNYLTSVGESATTTQTPGMNSGTGALLETVDAVTSDAIDAGVTKINGALIGQWSYSVPALESVTFDVDARPLSGDSAFIEVALFNFSGDMISKAEKIWTPADATSSWTSLTLPFVSEGNSGSVQTVRIVCYSSYSLGTTFDNYTTGSSLKVDNFTLNEESTSNTNEFNTLDVNAYPNPATDILNVETSVELSSLSILAMDGKVVTTKDINGTNGKVNIANLKAGVYFYELKTADGNISRNKFIKD